MRYKARADWFPAVSMLVGIAAPAFIAVTQNLPWMSLASVVAAALVFTVSYPQWYETRPDALIVRSGLTTRLIPYPRLAGVRPVAGGRLSIDYGAGSFIIAPQNIDQFVDDVATRAPQLSKRGQALVPASDPS